MWLTYPAIVTIVRTSRLQAATQGGNAMASVNQDMDVGENFLSVPEAARYLGVGRKVLYQLIEYNRIRAVRRRRVLLVDKESLDEFQRGGQIA
jgi:excisionase family DNA binding protein